jgi:secondary thiamine-phosphate synthase enzyme
VRVPLAPQTSIELIRIATRNATEFIDITQAVERIVAEAGIRFGLVNIQTLHTTTAIVVNEHEPLLLADFETMLGRIAPVGISYRHDASEERTENVTPNERVNGHAHCRALVLAPSASLNIVNGRILLGRWQRIFLAELDGPRERSVSVIVLGGD